MFILLLLKILTYSKRNWLRKMVKPLLKHFLKDNNNLELSISSMTVNSNHLITLKNIFQNKLHNKIGLKTRLLKTNTWFYNCRRKTINRNFILFLIKNEMFFFITFWFLKKPLKINIPKLSTKCCIYQHDFQYYIRVKQDLISCYFKIQLPDQI